MITTCTLGTLHAPRALRADPAHARRPTAWPSLADRGCRRRLEADPRGPQAAVLAARARRCSPSASRLPVFASDALSSVAYAPDEIFIMLAVAGGATAYLWSWQIALAVALVMLTVVASYRQNVHAYPSGGGDYEVATVNLGQNAGITVGERAARRLRAHRGGVDLVGRRQRRRRAAVRQRARGDATPACSWRALAALNLRGVRESGTLVRDPDLRLHAGDPRHGGLGRSCATCSASCPRSSRADLASCAGPGLRGHDHHRSRWSSCWPARSPRAARR